MTFPFEALTSLSGTKITAKISLQLRSRCFDSEVSAYFSVPRALSSSRSSSRSMQLLFGFSSAFPPLNLSVQERHHQPHFKTFQHNELKTGCKVWTAAITVKTLTLVDDHLLQLPLGRRPLQDLLVDGVGCDQAVHHYWFCLSYAVTAVLSLQVCLWVLERWQKHQTWTQWDMYKKQLL